MILERGGSERESDGEEEKSRKRNGSQQYTEVNGKTV